MILGILEIDHRVVLPVLSRDYHFAGQFFQIVNIMVYNVIHALRPEQDGR